jgi:pilus assembly protein CpaF
MSLARLLDAFKDAAVVELMINDDGSVYVERAAAALETLGFKAAPEEVKAFLKEIGCDHEFGAKRPFADLSASDGSRIHVLSPPLVRGSITVTIRKRPARRPTLDELATGGSMTGGCAAFLKYAVEERKNILVVGGTSSGKTTLLNALTSHVAQGDRILVAEDTPEVGLSQPHVVYMRTRLRDLDGLPDVNLRDLVVNTLRMRPDRIVVGEVRGAEAFDLLQAMNIGQEGVMATLHANSCREALHRLETLVLMAGLDMPLRSVRGHVAFAVDLLVFVARLSDGSRRVIQVSEVTGMDSDNILLSDLFVTETRKAGKGTRFTLKPTGSIPRFYEKLRQDGFDPPLEPFQK